MPPAADIPVFTVRFPWKATSAPAVESLIVTVLAVTVLWKATPPDWVMVMVPMSVPTAPATVTAPVVLRVRSLTAPAAVPVINPRLMVFAIPVPIVRVTPLAKVAFPKVIAPVDVPPTVEIPDTVTGVLPKLITPVPAAVIFPLMSLLEGAVAVTPPVNARVSPPLPKVKAPVLLKAVIPAIVLFAPVIEIA